MSVPILMKFPVDRPSALLCLFPYHFICSIFLFPTRYFNISSSAIYSPNPSCVLFVSGVARIFVCNIHTTVFSIQKKKSFFYLFGDDHAAIRFWISHFTITTIAGGGQTTLVLFFEWNTSDAKIFLPKNNNQKQTNNGIEACK